MGWLACLGCPACTKEGTTQAHFSACAAEGEGGVMGLKPVSSQTSKMESDTLLQILPWQTRGEKRL